MDILRDPLWNNIRLDSLALALLDTTVVQRLRYVRQLGLAYLVYPGASHSRFEHALGAHHLAGEALRLLDEQGQLSEVAPEEPAIVRAAALLHDIGHYPFSHALEEIGAMHHEEVAKPLLLEGAVANVLQTHLGSDAPARVFALITGTSSSPLQGLISGSLDLDKIEYLKRDAHMCGVPYGEIDVDRLLNSLVIVHSPFSGAHGVGVREKGLSALESLLFAKYQMFRNVYWHHAVRSATAMYKRLVAESLSAGLIEGAQVARFTDEGLLHHLDALPLPPVARNLLDGLRRRRLHKRALEHPAAVLGEGTGEWLASDYALTRRVEDALALDIPLNSKEGFLRQVIGWREFVRHVHEATDGFRALEDGTVAPTPGDGGWSRWSGRAWTPVGGMSGQDGGSVASHLGAQNPLPQAYWGAASGMACLDQVVGDVWREGYSHHITRLMVLSNIATLLDVSPRELTDWFWVAYADAWDWVVEPNVMGMGTHGVGEVMSTKPYVAGAAYINKMSDYCAGCRFDPAGNCPIRRLYWAFLARHEKQLCTNPRLFMPMNSVRKRSESDRALDVVVFEKVKHQLGLGKELAVGDFAEAKKVKGKRAQ